MVYVVIALVFGVVAAVIANDKGRNLLGWFLAGFFLGPFGLAVSLLPARPLRGKYAECPACLEVVRYDATVCRYCGTQFES
jgi:hypothetical protein